MPLQSRASKARPATIGPVERLEESGAHRRRAKAAVVHGLCARSSTSPKRAVPSESERRRRRNRDDARLLRDTPLECRERLCPPRLQRRRSLVAGGQVQLDARAQIAPLGNAARIVGFRIASFTVSIASGMPIAVSATWNTIAPVHTRPKRSVAPPARFARCGCTRARVALSAGRNDNIAAQTTARPPAYRTVVSLRPGVIQNGAPPEDRFTASIPHVSARSAAMQADNRCERRQDQGLDEELRDDAGPARAERGPYRNFTFACRRARIDERADARARDEQDQQHRPMPRGKRRQVRRVRRIRQPALTRGRGYRLRGRTRRSRPLAEEADLGAGLLPRDAGRQPADDADRPALERAYEARSDSGIQAS